MADVPVDRPCAGVEARSAIGQCCGSAVIVGEPGVGKSALLYGFAFHIVRNTRPLIPPDMDGLTLVSLSPVNLLSGTGARGELESRLDTMLGFFRKNPTVVPIFDEIHTLLDTDDPTARTVATALKPPMARGEFRCIGATTDKEYARFIASDEALNSRFTRLLVPEPDHEMAVQIISGTIGNILPKKSMSALTIEPEAISTAVSLSARYQRNDRLPRKAIRLLRMSWTAKLYSLQTGSSKDGRLQSADVAQTLSDLTGIPTDALSDADASPERSAHPAGDARARTGYRH